MSTSGGDHLARSRAAKPRGSAERLVDASLEILSEQGVAGLTIAEVSRVSGVSNGSLYHHFGGREGLLAACQARFFARVAEQWLEAGSAVVEERDPDQFLDLVLDGFEEVFGTNRKLFQAFMITGFHEAELRSRGVQFSRRTADLFTAMVVERFECSNQAADAAYRLLYGHSVLGVMFADEEVTSLPSSHEDRRALIRAALAAVLGRPRRPA